MRYQLACKRKPTALASRTMRTTIPTQPILAHGIAPGAWLARTTADGTEYTWRVLDVQRHPTKLDRVVISGDAGHGLIDAHLSDWFRRVIPT